MVKRQKYIKHKVKRQHSILQEILPLLEELGKIDGIRKIVPARISYSPSRRIKETKIKLQRETQSGFKLLAHSKGGIQEIFIVVSGNKKKEVENHLLTIINEPIGDRDTD